MKILWKGEDRFAVERLPEVHVLEGKHITCISVHELVCVFHLFKWPVLKAKKMFGSPMDSLKEGARIWGQIVVFGEGELYLFYVFTWTT